MSQGMAKMGFDQENRCVCVCVCVCAFSKVLCLLYRDLI
jgi:hypothetical protein